MPVGKTEVLRVASAASADDVGVPFDVSDYGQITYFRQDSAVANPRLESLSDQAGTLVRICKDLGGTDMSGNLGNTIREIQGCHRWMRVRCITGDYTSGTWSVTILGVRKPGR
jgi:hypothetical protein